MTPEIRRLAEKLRAERKRVEDEPEACRYCGLDPGLAGAAWDVALAVVAELDKERPR